MQKDCLYHMCYQLELFKYGKVLLCFGLMVKYAPKDPQLQFVKKVEAQVLLQFF